MKQPFLQWLPYFFIQELREHPSMLVRGERGLLILKSQSISVFMPDSVPQIYRGDRPLTDTLLPDLSLTAAALLLQAGL